VVVISKCEACGECQFKNVKCMSKKGISADSYDDFMYKKFENIDVSEEINANHNLHVIIPATCLAGIALVAFVASGTLRVLHGSRHTGLELPSVVGTDRYVAVSSLADETSPMSNIDDEEA